jgi:hypothetical protein
MALAKKMYVPAGTQVPCVNLVADVELDDIHPWAASFDAARLSKLWNQKISFWVFYPKAPHLKTDLNRDKTWQLMLKAGMKGTRQVGIDELWSCMYFKNA